MSAVHRPGEPSVRVSQSSQCGTCTACSAAPAEAPDAPLSGWIFAGAGSFYFIVPLVVAIGVASFASGGTGIRSLAALAGLVLGVVLTTTIAGFWTRYLAAKETHHG